MKSSVLSDQTYKIDTKSENPPVKPPFDRVSRDFDGQGRIECQLTFFYNGKHSVFNPECSKNNSFMFDS